MDHDYNVRLAAEIIRILCEHRKISADQASDLVGSYFVSKLFDPYFTRREITRLLRISRLCESYVEWVFTGHRQDRIRERFKLIVKLGKQDSLYDRVSPHLDMNWSGGELMFSDLEFSHLPKPGHPDDLLEFAAELRRVAPLLPVRKPGKKTGAPLAQEARTLWAAGLDLPLNESDIVRKLKQHGVSDAVARKTAYDYRLR